jgi:integrase
MPRTVKEASLGSRTPRLRLAVQTKPYWRALEQGLHLGYRRSANGGAWIGRRRTEQGAYRETRLGVADDQQDADGGVILNFAQAQTACRQWWNDEQRLDQGLSARGRGPYTVAQACAAYQEDYRRRGGKAVHTIASAFGSHVLPQLGPLAISKLTARRLQDWHRTLAEQPRRARTRKGKEQRFLDLDTGNGDAVRRRRATANRVLTYLKAALNLAWREELVSSDHAWRRVKPFKSVDAPVIRYLSHDEITRLLNTTQGAFRDLVHGALLTGCRYGELTRLRVADYNPEAGILTIRISKGGKMRHVTLTEEGVALCDRLIAGRGPHDLVFRRDDGNPWKAAHQGRPMADACVRAHIREKATFHVLRHTHGSQLAMRGVPMAVIAKQLGHADTRMTERHYAHLAPNYITDTIRANLPRLTERPSNLVPITRRA